MKSVYAVIVFAVAGATVLFAASSREIQLSDYEAKMTVGGQGPGGDGWGPTLLSAQCQLFHTDCMGPPDSCSSRTMADCNTRPGVDLGPGPALACTVIVPEDNDKVCQNRAWGINELQSPCATYHNCAWFTGVGCAITIAGTTPNPLAQYAPKDCRDL